MPQPIWGRYGPSWRVTDQSREPLFPRWRLTYESSLPVPRSNLVTLWGGFFQAGRTQGDWNRVADCRERRGDRSVVGNRLLRRPKGRPSLQGLQGPPTGAFQKNPLAGVSPRGIDRQPPQIYSPSIIPLASVTTTVRGIFWARSVRLTSLRGAIAHGFNPSHGR